VTTEATEAVWPKILPGFGEPMRAGSLKYVPTGSYRGQRAGFVVTLLFLSSRLTQKVLIRESGSKNCSDFPGKVPFTRFRSFSLSRGDNLFLGGVWNGRSLLFQEFFWNPKGGLRLGGTFLGISFGGGKGLGRNAFFREEGWGHRREGVSGDWFLHKDWRKASGIRKGGTSLKEG